MEMPGMCNSAALARSVHSVVTVLFWRGFRDDVFMVMMVRMECFGRLQIRPAVAPVKSGESCAVARLAAPRCSTPCRCR